MRAVLNTNVVVSGVIKEEGPSGQILSLFLEEGKFIAVTSLDVLAEIRTVLDLFHFLPCRRFRTRSKSVKISGIPRAVENSRTQRRTFLKFNFG